MKMLSHCFGGSAHLRKTGPHLALQRVDRCNPTLARNTEGTWACVPGQRAVACGSACDHSTRPRADVTHCVAVRVLLPHVCVQKIVSSDIDS